MNPQQLLTRILEGATVQAADIDLLLQRRVPEGLFIDYKNGKATDKNETKEELRKDVSAFANSEGGIIIFGVDDQTRTVSSCNSVGTGSLSDWAASCIRPIAAQLTEMPRFIDVSHPSGQLLVIAVARSSHLVSVVIKGMLCWFMRVHEGTVQAPDYLVADLMLGRRKSPRLNIRVHENLAGAVKSDPLSKYHSPGLGFLLRMENNSPTWIEDVRVEMIRWSQEKTETSLLLSDYLLSLLDVKSPNRSDVNLVRTDLTAPRNDKDSSDRSLAPLSAMLCGMGYTTIFPYGFSECSVYAALLVTVKGFDFSLYQLEFPSVHPTRLLSVTDDATYGLNPVITRLYGSRARIEWHRLGVSPS